MCIKMKLTVIFLNLFVVFTVCYELKQVFILSRHNIRTPLTANLEDYSSYPWPKWKESVSYLTEKGALMEEYMGEYIHERLIREKLFKDGCPDENSVYIYSNSKQRTRESAKAFVRGAFKNCNISVVSLNSEEVDPVFNPVYRNDSKTLRELIFKEMQKKIKDLNLNKSYSELEEILDLKNSTICEMKGICKLTEVTDEIYLKIGEEPNIIGPLAWANSIADSFLMSYYEGWPLENVAWGKIINADQWTTLTKITKENQNIRFNSTLLGRHVANPLLGYMSSVFNVENPTKFTLLHGHDSNLNSVMAALGFWGYLLPEQYETTPIGGKLVLQKWYDNKQNKDLLKIDFVYLTVNQLRAGSKLSSSNPPRSVQLSMQDCYIDSNGFCSWEDFIKILKDASGF